MDKVLLLLSSLLLFTSCAEQYNIAGNSSVSSLDGRMLYLRVSPNEGAEAIHTASVCLDSCKVVHGRFQFVGNTDSPMMAMLYAQNQCVMPIVIENGDLNIQVDNVAQRVSGSPLNEKLYNFFKKRNRLDNEMWELQQKSIRMIHEGCTPEDIQHKVGKKVERIARRTEELETQFVKENYHNVLGPGFFMLLCSQYPTPIITSQIQEIIDAAPETFLHNPFVWNYIQRARNRSIPAHPLVLPVSTTTITVQCP